VTAPRQILPGKSYLVTRRCSERRLFLKPSPETNGLFLFVLAVAARRFGVLVHAYCVLSNHYHLVVTDPDACLPAFMQYLDSLVARAMNAWLGRFEGFWASDSSYSAVTPLDPEDVVAKAAYVLANPVAAGLVRDGAEWPGLRSSPAQIGKKVVARRPEFFFSNAGPMPETIELELAAPPGFAPELFATLLSGAVAELEKRHRQEIESTGRGFLGVARVLAQRPLARPSSREPRFNLDPRIAARDRWRRMEGILSMKRFRQEYREAWRAWCAGVRDVAFPAGTYLLRVLHGVQCAGAA
jgi:REP element-mobilizing transposase RayT